MLVRTTDDNPLLRQTVLVDRDRGVQFKLPVPGLASFLSGTEVAVTSPRRRSVTILPAAEHAAATATCDVPGDYTFLENVFGLPDGTMAVETSSGGSRALVILQILQRGCRVRATFSGEVSAATTARRSERSASGSTGSVGRFETTRTVRPGESSKTRPR